jgi:transcriptional regulator with XRE-family HTH domain
VQQPTLKQLLARVRVLTNPKVRRGRRAKLAKDLGVSRSLVTGWLSGIFEPGGDLTLQLLKWVAAEEAQQNKSPGTAQTAPERKTRRKANREKDKPSGRRKK